MSHQSDDEGDGEKPSGSYDVGYRKPPVEHRFKKGQSGNPRGRPRKAKISDRYTDPDFGTQLANALLLEEAYRPVTIREGDKTFQIPALQASYRSWARSAVTGNRLAQKTLAEQVRAVEAADHKDRLEYLQAMIEYKSCWELAIERARKLGLPEPQPIPHPDDVIIDFVARTASVCGPMTNQEKASWDRILECREEIQGQVSEFAEAYRKARSPHRKALQLDLWMREQNQYDRINDNLPKRYRKQLQDRCWEPSATRRGSQKKRTWPREF